MILFFGSQIDYIRAQLTFLVLLKGGDIMRSGWVPRGEIVHILASLMPENRLACEISLITGLRIGDVLSLRTEKVKKGRFTIQEQKTGKRRQISLPADIVRRCLECGNEIYVFPNRYDGRRHRTRQAINKDIERVARMFRLKEHVSPHSLRKIYAVAEFEKCGSLARVQKLLNHNSESVTMLYAMANVLSKRKNFKQVNVTKSRNK